MSNRLAREDWITEGLRLLREVGVDSVRVEPLAKRLGVTKGSFYWHFADRPALLSALCDAWRERSTVEVAARVEAAGGTPRDRLERLFRLTASADGRLERAMRAWAAHDPLAQAVVACVDERRIAYLVTRFEEIGCDAQTALARARFGYLALIGHYTRQEADNSENWLSDSLDRMLPLLLA